MNYAYYLYEFDKGLEELHNDRKFEMNALITLQQSVRCIIEAKSIKEALSTLEPTEELYLLVKDFEKRYWN